MKVLMLSTSFPRWSGDWAGSFVLDLASALSERNEVTVLAPGFPECKVDDQFGEVLVKRFHYWRPSSLERVIYPDGIPDQLKKSLLARIQVPAFLCRFAREARRMAAGSDVVLCNWAVTGVAAGKTGKPYAVVIRGSDMRTLEKGGLQARVYIKALRRAGAVCTVAEDFVDPLKKLGLKNVRFTPNGVDLEQFRERGTAVGKPTVLFVGSLIERKGLRYLIQAMAGVPALLRVVGEGLQRDKMVALAERLEVDVDFVGILPKERMPEEYKSADIFVLPSLYEGRPNVLIEAMASGCPCVATDIKGSRELLRDGQDGLLVAPRDANMLNDRLVRLVRDKDARSRLGKSGGRRIRDMIPTWEESARSYEEVLDGIRS